MRNISEAFYTASPLEVRGIGDLWRSFSCGRWKFVENHKKETLTGCLCALGSEILFGLSFVFTRQVSGQAEPLELLGWRFVTAFSVLTVCAKAGLLKLNLRKKPVRHLLTAAVFSPILYFLGETFGVNATSASESGIMIACVPVASMIASARILKKSPSKLQVIGISVTLAGVILTVAAAGLTATLSLPGYLFLTAAVVSFAVYSALVEQAEGFSSAEITYVTTAAGAAFFGISAIVQAAVRGTLPRLLTLPANPDFLTAFLYGGIGCSVLAFFMQNTALRRIGVNRTASFIGVSTVVSILAGIVLLRETLSAAQLLGAGIIIAGIYIANMNMKT